MDPAHPFPFVSNLSLNLLVTGAAARSLRAAARARQGAGRPGHPALPARSATQRHFVPLEDVMAHNLDSLFPGMTITVQRAVPRHAQRQHRARRRRGRRSAGADRDRAARAPLRADRAPRGRNRAWTRVHRSMLAGRARPDDAGDVFEVDGMLAARDLMELASIDDGGLHDPPLHPIEPPRLPADCATSSTASATPARCWSFTRTNRSPAPSSASCAKPARTRKCARSR